ncbi:MAG: 50S ribosomal protein L21, partial [Maricaulaceae bacterium]
MFAVIKTGGKQYKVAKDDEIIVERLDGAPGELVALCDVMMINSGDAVQVGAPLVDGAGVLAEVVHQRKGEKNLIFKKKRRSTYRRKKGHRQLETVLRIHALATDEAGLSAAREAWTPAISEPATEEAEAATGTTTAETVEP